jgi:hypothetical protein
MALASAVRSPARRLSATLLFLTAVAAAYLVVALWINGGTIFKASYVSYFTLLMEGFSHGHLWITGNEGLGDLAEFQGHVYLYWGPSPLLLVAPLYFFGHGFQYDVAYTLALGIASVVALAWMIPEAARALRITLRGSTWAWMTLLFAFASPNFYLSVQGRIWHTSQIGAALYCLLFLAFTFRFMNRRRLVDIVLAAVCFSLSWDARMPFLATGPILFYAVAHAWQRDRTLGLKALAGTAVVGVCAIGGWAFYNHARFGSFTETGYTYTHHAPRFVEGVRTGTLWSWRYLRHNWHYNVRNWPFDTGTWRFAFDQEGNSILWMYPWTTLTWGLPLLLTRVAREARPLLYVVMGVALIQFAAEMTFFSSGYTQVGARYFLDSVPVLFVMLLPVFERAPRLLLAVGVVVGLVLNVAGMSDFYNVPLTRMPWMS